MTRLSDAIADAREEYTLTAVVEIAALRTDLGDRSSVSSSRRGGGGVRHALPCERAHTRAHHVGETSV